MSLLLQRESQMALVTEIIQRQRLLPAELRKCQTGREDGREDRDVHRFDGNRRFDRYVRQRPQQKPESRISYRTGKVNAGSNG